ncbi:adenylosuccinate lyase [bacterium]|nr:adenylosuccinate lyase [bacterium]
MNEYRNPLIERYASKEMSYIFSPEFKFRTWRRLWIALAKAEKELGVNITDEQIRELESKKDEINFETAWEREKEVRHDVVAHIYAYGVQCPKARPIIHLGATSAFVGDNTDLIQMREGMRRIRTLLLSVIRKLASFAGEHASLPTLGFTHFQPAQPTTVGKRASMWLQDLISDYRDLVWRLRTLPFRGAKGATGTQASFMRIFDGDKQKVGRLDELLAKEIGFEPVLPVTGQTYSRKIDCRILDVLSGIAQSASKFATDVRLLSNLREIEEPFEEKQVGSSSMAYKRNPMRCERMTSLSRYLIHLSHVAQTTAATQWLERTLDDSAARRMVIPEAFLSCDAILTIYLNVVGGMRVYPAMIGKRLASELPFMATENILMEAVKRGGDRQVLHEKIREYARQAAAEVKRGEENRLLEMIAADQSFKMTADDVSRIMDPSEFVGRAPQQVEQFLKDVVDPILEENSGIAEVRAEVEV